MSDEASMRKKALYPANKKYGGLKAQQVRGPRRYFDSGDFFKEQQLSQQQQQQQQRRAGEQGGGTTTAARSRQHDAASHGSALATTVQDCATSPPDSPLTRTRLVPHQEQPATPSALASPGSASATAYSSSSSSSASSASSASSSRTAALSTSAPHTLDDRRTRRSQTVCGEQPDAATAGYNPAQFQAITSIEDIRNILMPRRERLGEDVATPSPLASSCRLPTRERNSSSKHERKRSHHRKSIGGVSELAKVTVTAPDSEPPHADDKKKQRKKHHKQHEDKKD